MLISIEGNIDDLRKQIFFHPILILRGGGGGGGGHPEAESKIYIYKFSVYILLIYTLHI